MPSVALLSSSRWHGYLGSMRSLATGVAELGHRTLFVDPPVSPLSLVRQPKRLADLFGAVDEVVGPGVNLWHPRVVPGQNTPAGQALNARLLARGVRKRIGEPDALVATALESRGVLARASAPTAYVCIDSFADQPFGDNDAKRAREREMTSSVDVVAACSLPLQRQFREQGIDAVYLPHGCDREFLVAPGSLPVPAALVGRPRPLVGYVGSLNYRVDVSLLRAVAAATSGTVVLVGGMLTGAGPFVDIDDLLARPNVVAVGHQPHAELAAFVSALDVGLVPYTETAFNHKSYPLKIPQYLGAAVPVVSTPNGATEELARFVHVASTAEGFVQAVEAAAATAEGDRLAAQQAMASRPWSVVAQELLDACWEHKP